MLQFITHQFPQFSNTILSKLECVTDIQNVGSAKSSKKKLIYQKQSDITLGNFNISLILHSFRKKES